VAAIERELASLWRMPTVVGLRDVDIVPTRTSVLNLVVYTGSDEVFRRAHRIIGELATTHPSRAIIFTASGDPHSFDNDIDAHVSTHCYAADSERFAACFEQVQITVPTDSFDVLPSIVVSLALPDLPTFVWWPGQPPLGDHRFRRIAQTADRLVIDSLDFTHCAINLVRTATLCLSLRDCCATSDLNWARLTPWRAMTAKLFDAPDTRWALDHVTQLSLTYGHASGSRTSPAQALLFAGWAASRLGWHLESAHQSEANAVEYVVRDPRGQAVVVTLNEQPTSREYNGCLLKASMDATDGGQSAHFEIERMGADLSTLKSVSAVSDQTPMEHAMHAPPVTIAKLLIHELERTMHDEMYEDALQEASRFAARLRNRGTA
jgi:glucose-6-phosphate dehydrogenase assembly protein OpcA